MNKLFASVLTLVALASPGFRQSVTPVRGAPRSFTNGFAVRLTIGNLYPQIQTFAVRVYDDKFYPVEATLPMPEVTLAAGASRTVLAIISFDGMNIRRVRICAEGLFGGPNTTKLRTQVCENL